MAANGRFGHLRLIEEIGRGGAAVVYRAREDGSRRETALKLPKGDAAFAHRLRDEGGVLARLSHRNIVRLHGVGEAEGRTYLSFELVSGKPLVERITGDASRRRSRPACWQPRPRPWGESTTAGSSAST